MLDITTHHGSLRIRVTTIAEAGAFGFDPATHWQIIVSHPVAYALDFPGYEDHYDRKTSDLFAAFDRRILAAGYIYDERYDETPGEDGGWPDGEFHIYRRPA